MKGAGPGSPSARKGGAEERLRTIIDRLADGVVIVGQDGRVRFANPAAQRLFGRSAPELEGEELGLPVMAGENTEVDVVRPGGQVVAAELRAVHTEWEDELAYLVSLRDVTDRREAEERRREVEREQAARLHAEGDARRARFLSDVSAALAASLDYHDTLRTLARLAVPELADWCVIDVREDDGRLARIAGAHAEGDRAALIDTLREEFPPLPGGPSPAARAMDTGRAVLEDEVSEAVLEAITRSPEHAALVRALGMRSYMAVPLKARGDTLGAVTFARATARYGPTDLALAEDFAQRAAQSVVNARLYHEAQAASRAKSEFLAVMSHELRTPLNAVTGYADLLQAGVAGEVAPEQRELLDRIKGSALSLVDVIEEILTFSRMESGREEVQAQRIDLRELVGKTGEMLAPLARQKGLEFEVKLPEAPALVETDPAKVLQVLRNLVTNAVKFTERGEVSVEGLRDHTHHLVRVRDTGIGIAAEHRDRVFEPFWQVEQSARREVGGTGLGLAVARGLAELLGGDLRMESRPGEGTTFTLALPAAD